MRYVGHCTLAPDAAGNAVSHVWSINSCHDPDVTGLGHRPLGFDQYMEFYNHYTVTHAKIKVTFLASATWALGVAYLTRKANTDVIINRETLGEQPSTQMKRLDSAYDGQPVVFTDTVDVSSLFGVKDVANDDIYRGSASTSPTERYYWHLSAASFSGAAGTGIAVVEIEYKVALHEPKDVLGSI